MSWGAMLRYPDGTPFYISGTIPMALVYKRDFSYSTSDYGHGQDLEDNNDAPYIYFVRFNEEYSTAYHSPNSGKRQIIFWNNRQDNVTGTIYCFGAVPQTPPKYGVAIWNEKNECILTNETKTLKGINVTGASGPAGTALYLNEKIPGRKAIIPGRTGTITYGGIIGGRPVLALEQYATNCYYDGVNTIVRSTPYNGGSQMVPITQNFSLNYRPAYIDCSIYD